MLSFTQATWPINAPRKWQADAWSAAVSHLAVESHNSGIISAVMGSGKSMLIAELAATASLRDMDIVVISTPTELLVDDLSKAIRDRTGKCGYWYGRKKQLGRIIVTCLPSISSLAVKLKKVNYQCALWLADEVHRSESSTVLSAHAALNPLHAIGFTATPFRTKLTEHISLFDSTIYRYRIADAMADGVLVPWKIVHDDVGGDLDSACLNFILHSSGPGVVNASSIEDAEKFAQFLTTQGIHSNAIHSKLHPVKKKSIMRDLESERIKAVVYVNMLSEGANFPWLRWMVLRRQVSSRVRFIQEIGRLLRSHPGKAECVYFDPHDLFGQFKLSYQEALGEAPEKRELDFEIKTPEEFSERIKNSDPAVAMQWIESLIRSLIVICDSCGMIHDRRIIKKVDRFNPCNAMQFSMIQVLVLRTAKIVPAEWFHILNAICSDKSNLRFGFAADLIVSLNAIARYRIWPQLGVVSDLPLRTELNGQTVIDFGKLENS